MKIHYDDGFGTPIPEDEIAHRKYYAVVYSEDGEVKRQDSFYEGVMNKQLFFTESDQDHQKLFQEKFRPGIMTSVGVRQYIEEFRYERIYSYDKEGQFVGFLNVINDQAGHTIATSYSEDMEGKTYDWESMRKSYKDESIRKGDELFYCHFDANGKLLPVDIDVEELGLGDQDSVAVLDDEESVQDLMRIFGMSRKLAEFYTSSALFPWESTNYKM